MSLLDFKAIQCRQGVMRLRLKTEEKLVRWSRIEKVQMREFLRRGAQSAHDREYKARRTKRRGRHGKVGNAGSRRCVAIR